MHRFRVFVSYAHEDRSLAKRMVDGLLEMGLEPVWDQDIRPGMAFTDAIRDGIARAHIFMPLITENSQKRPWVHQETGYAIGINVPVLPVAVENLPGEMIAQLQAITVKPDLSDFTERLQGAQFDQVVIPPPQRPPALFEVAEWPEARSEMIARYSNRVLELGKFGRVLFRSPLSTFSVPDKDVTHPIWALRDGYHPRSTYFRHHQREERQALERHARKCGCSMIIDPATESFNTVGKYVRWARLYILLEFLEAMVKDEVEVSVVISSRAREGNLTIVGDWFVADSLVPRTGQGYLQTIFSTHAPTVLRAVHKFDQEFRELAAQSNLKPDQSCNAAIRIIKDHLGRLDHPPDYHPPSGDAIPC